MRRAGSRRLSRANPLARVWERRAAGDVLCAGEPVLVALGFGYEPLPLAHRVSDPRVEDRALWATAFYGGLRRGELRGLWWAVVDLAAGGLRVERGWDDSEGENEPKSQRGRRKVPIAPILRDYLVEHRAIGPRPKRPQPSPIGRVQARIAELRAASRKYYI